MAVEAAGICRGDALLVGIRLGVTNGMRRVGLNELDPSLAGIP